MIGLSFLWSIGLSRDSPKSNIYVCDIELAGSVEKDVDRMLEYFWCPIPGLVPLPKSQQLQKLRDLMHSGSVIERLAAVAHCRSFKDLQYLASVASFIEAESEQWKEVDPWIETE